MLRLPSKPLHSLHYLQCLFYFSLAPQVHPKLPYNTITTARMIRTIEQSASIDQALSSYHSQPQLMQYYGKTAILEYFNQLPIDIRSRTTEPYQRVLGLLETMQRCSLYENIVKLSVLEKIRLLVRDEDRFNRAIGKCQEDLIRQLETDGVDIYHCTSYLCVFKFQKYRAVTARFLRETDRLILNIDMDLNMLKSWLPVVHQLGFLTWDELKPHRNIIMFFTDLCDFPYSAFELEKVCDLFIKITRLSLHKVGLKRVPKMLYSMARYLQPLIKKMPVELACVTLEACMSLPASFQPQFRSQLREHLLGTNDFIYKCFRQNSLFKLLSTNEINLYFSQKQNQIHLWHLVAYNSEIEKSKYFYRGAIVKFFKSFIDEKLKQTAKIREFIDKNQVNRLSYCCRYFVQTEDHETVDKLRILFSQIIKNFGYEAFSEMPFADFFVMMHLFESNPKIVSDIQTLFEATMARRKQKALKLNNLAENYKRSAIQIMKMKPQIIKEGALRLVKLALAQGQDSFAFKVDIIFSIMNSHSVHADLLNLKDEFVRGLSEDQFEIFLERYIITENQLFKGVQELIVQSMQRKYPLQKLLVFLTSINPKHLINIRGRLEKNLQTLLLSHKQPIGFGMADLNEANRILSVLSQFKVEAFCMKFYFDVIATISEQIQSQKWQLLTTSSNLITTFVFKFEYFMGEAGLDNGVKKMLVEKVQGIMNVLLEKDKKNLHLRVKLLYFFHFYKGFLRTPEGVEIEALHIIQEELKKSTNIQKHGHICFILLKLHCFGLINMKRDELAYANSSAFKAIQSGSLSVFKMREQAKSISASLRARSITAEEKKLFGDQISSLFIASLRTTNTVSNFHIAGPFVQFFYRISSSDNLTRVTKQIMKEQQMLTLQTIDFLISKLPLAKIDHDILNAIVQKTQKMANLLPTSHVTLNVLFLFERLFHQTPEQYQPFVQRLWMIINENIKCNIEAAKRASSMDEKLHILGRYPLYLFCCIKAGLTHCNPNYDWLCQMIANNPNQLKNRIKDNPLQSFINSSLVNIVLMRHNSEHPNKPIETVEVDASSLFQTFSTKFQTQLKTKGQPYKTGHKINKVTIPYYLAEKKQGFFILSRANQISINGKPEHNGLVKYYERYLKIMLPSIKVYAYDESKQAITAI